MTEAEEREGFFRDVIDVLNARGPDAMLELMPADLELSPDPSFPEPGPFTGEALRRWMRDWWTLWESVELQLLDLEHCSAAILARCQWQLRSGSSGMDVPRETFTFVALFAADGKPHRVKAFFSHEEALRAIP